MRVGLGFDRRDASTDALASVIHRAVAEALRGASGLDTPLPGTSEADARDALETGARMGAGSAEGELREAVRQGGATVLARGAPGKAGAGGEVDTGGRDS